MIYECNGIAANVAPDGLRKCGPVTDTAGDPAQNLASAQEQGNGQTEKQPGKEHGEGVHIYTPGARYSTREKPSFSARSSILRRSDAEQVT